MGRLASDIGGTFTDLVYFDDETGQLKVEKSLTTPKDLTQGVEDTIRLAQVEPEKIDFFVHGGTTVINAITERKGAKTALVTTAGFRDVLEIARGNRPDLYNLNFEKPVPFVPRRLRFEVRERMDAAGNEVEPLMLGDLDAVIERCLIEGVEAVAVQLLHSYAAPQHEAACAAYLRDKMPGVAVTASCEITREWREYERANTAVLNAYVQPIVQRYFASLESSLGGQGIDCPFAAMQSNGGSTSFAWAKAHPITLVESGPSAGVNGAALVAELCGEEDAIYLDIGGTTAKCSVIEGAQVKVTTDYKLEWTRINPGYPVKVPVVDIVEIGTGGGSIAWFDKAGTLKVGPVSAGSDPGPASYGQGGTEPTVTDAKLLTGVLDPDYFAGGSIKLDTAAAERAIDEKIATPLGLDLIDAADAIAGEAARATLANYRPRLILNRVRYKRQIEEAHRFQTLVKEYLSTEMKYVGYVRSDIKILDACERRRPLMIDNPKAPAARASLQIRHVEEDGVFPDDRCGPGPRTVRHFECPRHVLGRAPGGW
mgnify:CR=1 FL=1